MHKNLGLNFNRSTFLVNMAENSERATNADLSDKKKKVKGRKFLLFL